MSIIIRQSIKGTIVNYVGSFIGFLTTMFVLTEFLQPEEIGLTTTIYNAAFLVGAFVQLGTSASTFRFFPYFKNEQNGHNGFFFYLLLMPTIGALIFIPLYIFLREPISLFFSEESPLFVDYYYWVIPLILFISYWTVFETYSAVQMRIVVPKFIREVLIRILLLVVYLLFAFKWLHLDGLVGGYIAVYGVAMIVTFGYLSRIGSISLKHDFSFIDKPLRKKISNYTFFLLFSALSGSILSQLDIFMVGSQLGLDSVGIYTIAFYMAIVIEIPSRSITTISSPIAADSLKRNDFELANRLYKTVSLHQLIAGSCIFLLIWINIDNIFALIPNGHVYAAGKWVVFFIALSRIVGVTLNFGSTLISFSRYYYWGLFFTIFITVIGIGTNLLLIPKMGITGAAIATLITTVLQFSVQQWIVLIKIKGNPFSVALFKQLFLLLISFGLNYILPQWSNNPFVDGIYRSCVVGLFILFCIYKWRISEELCTYINGFLKQN